MGSTPVTALINFTSPFEEPPVVVLATASHTQTIMASQNPLSVSVVSVFSDHMILAVKSEFSTFYPGFQLSWLAFSVAGEPLLKS